jgi:hypothetical protein
MHLRDCILLLLCGLVVGCTNSPVPPRSALLEDFSFAYGLDECARHEPLSTRQLVAFIGDPDISVPWTEARQTLSKRPGIDDTAAEAAMKHMQDKYTFNRGAANTTSSNTPSMDHVDIWFYMWNEPSKHVFSDMLHTPAGRASWIVLVEKGQVVGVTDVLFQ